MKSDVADTFDWRVDSYRGWLWWCAWQAARGDRDTADRLWREWRRTHGA